MLTPAYPAEEGITCRASCLAHGPHTPHLPHSRREESSFTGCPSSFWSTSQCGQRVLLATESLFFSSLRCFEESGEETGSHIGLSALCSKDGLNTPGPRLPLPGAGITGLHRHTQFMEGWESNSDSSHAGQALCAALLRRARNPSGLTAKNRNNLNKLWEGMPVAPQSNYKM